MTLEHAIKIMNYETFVSKDEELEAYRVFFKEIANVDIQNTDGTYKCMYQIFEEGYNNIHGRESANEQAN